MEMAAHPPGNGLLQRGHRDLRLDLSSHVPRAVVLETCRALFLRGRFRYALRGEAHLSPRTAVAVGEPGGRASRRYSLPLLLAETRQAGFY